MKNFENLGLEELTMDEMVEIDGGEIDCDINQIVNRFLDSIEEAGSAIGESFWSWYYGS